jgi:hypothetical protein
MSCLDLHPGHHCISTAGARSNPPWLSSLLEQSLPVFCGFDADPTGDLSYQIRRVNAPPLRQFMALSLEEFWRRFCLHILPERFVKIRHYGLLANRGRQERLQRAKAALAPDGVEACDPQSAGRVDCRVGQRIDFSEWNFRSAAESGTY